MSIQKKQNLEDLFYKVFEDEEQPEKYGIVMTTTLDTPDHPAWVFANFIPNLNDKLDNFKTACLATLAITIRLDIIGIANLDKLNDLLKALGPLAGYIEVDDNGHAVLTRSQQ